MARTIFTASLILPVAAALLVGCPSNNGTDPPADGFFFPIAAAQSADGDTLFVANSDFDLRYNGGTVVSVDLALVRARAAEVARSGPQNCTADPNAAGAAICPAREFIRARFTRKINPFAVDLAVARYPERERVYVVVRGDGSLTWLDATPGGGLDCGGPAEPASPCDDAHRAGVDTAQSPVGARLPPDPSSLSVDPQRGWVVVSHQSVDPNFARASLFRDPAFTAGAGGAAGPTLLNVVGGLAPGLSSLALLGRSADDPTRSTWVSTSRSEASLTFLQAYPGNPQLGDALPFLYRSATARVEGLSTGANNRNVLLDPARPGRAYLISRAPESMLTVQFDPAAPTRVQVVDAVPLPPGPSRLAFVPGARPMVLAVSYDARQVTLVDLGAQRVVGQVFTNRGPHTVVVDPRGPWAYVLDFLDAAVEVIDLRPEVDGAANRSYLRRVLTLGSTGP
jgi:DNA-binding beta-propeller fold protein YncE